MTAPRSVARSLPPRPSAPASSARPRRLYAPHPDGPVVQAYESDEAFKREDLKRRFVVTTWVIGEPHRRYLQVFDSAAVRGAIADAGCPHAHPVLMVAWIILRRCPVCFRRIIPHSGMLRERHGLVRLVRRQFCGDRCARQDLRDQLADPTRAQIDAACLRIQEGWDDADRLRAHQADPLRELLADLSDSLPLDPTLLAL